MAGIAARADLDAVPRLGPVARPRLAEWPGGTIVVSVQIILCARDSSVRERLRMQLSASGYRVEEVVSSPAALRHRLEQIEPPGSQLRPAAELDADTLVVAGPGWLDAEDFAKVALEYGVPVAVWPLGPASRRAPDRPASQSLGLRPLAAQRLTDREREVLQWVAAGISNKGIARRLGLSPNTVKFHVAAVLAKLGASTRAEAVATAARKGEISL